MIADVGYLPQGAYDKIPERVFDFILVDEEIFVGWTSDSKGVNMVTDQIESASGRDHVANSLVEGLASISRRVDVCEHDKVKLVRGCQVCEHIFTDRLHRKALSGGNGFEPLEGDVGEVDGRNLEAGAREI